MFRKTALLLTLIIPTTQAAAEPSKPLLGEAPAKHLGCCLPCEIPVTAPLPVINKLGPCCLTRRILAGDNLSLTEQGCFTAWNATFAAAGFTCGVYSSKVAAISTMSLFGYLTGGIASGLCLISASLTGIKYSRQQEFIPLEEVAVDATPNSPPHSPLEITQLADHLSSALIFFDDRPTLLALAKPHSINHLNR